MKFTKQSINALPGVNKGKQQIVWDSVQRGLGLRCTAGSKSFIFQSRLDGQTIRLTIGAWPDWSVEAARERAREFAVQIDRNIDPRAANKAKVAQPTLQETYEQFLKERQLRPRTKKDYDRYLNYYLSGWKSKALSSIDSAMITRRYQEIAKSRSGAAQASSVMRFLRSLYNFAGAAHGRQVVPENPVMALTAKRVWIRDKARTDHLATNEIKPFVETVRKLKNPVMAAYIEFVLLTGARRGEAATLKWQDVKMQRRVLTFRDTKNHSDRTIPITPRVAQILDTMRTLRMGDYVFAVMGKDGEPTHLTEPRKAMAAANKAAKSKVTVHGLRRTYATILESLDCPAYPLKALLGHSLKGDITTAHYAQINVERLRPWAKRYEDKVLELISEKAGATSEQIRTM